MSSWGLQRMKKTRPASGGFSSTDQPRSSSSAGVGANTTEAETKPKQKFALLDLAVSSGQPLAVATNDAQAVLSPAEPQAASSVGDAQIQATPPKTDQEIPLQLPSTTPPQEEDDKRIPVATSTAQDEDMPATSPAQCIAASATEHAQMLAQIQCRAG